MRTIKKIRGTSPSRNSLKNLLNLINQLVKTTGSEYDKAMDSLTKSYREKSHELGSTKEARREVMRNCWPSHCSLIKLKLRKQSIKALETALEQINKLKSSSAWKTWSAWKPAQPETQAWKTCSAWKSDSTPSQFNLKNRLSLRNLLQPEKQLSLKNQLSRLRLQLKNLLNRRLRLSLKKPAQRNQLSLRNAQPEPAQHKGNQFNQAPAQPEKPAQRKLQRNRKNQFQPETPAQPESNYFFQVLRKG